MDEKFLKEGDECGISPANCEKGFSFSIWEKNSFPKSILNPVPESEKVPSHWLSQFHKRKYLVTSGPVPLFNRTTGRAFPGFELYRQVSVLNLNEDFSSFLPYLMIFLSLV